MISAELRAQMRRLVLAEGWKIETVARRFGVHHSVVRRALRDEPERSRPGPGSRLEPFKPYIVQRLTALPELTAVRLFAELRARDFPLVLTQLRRYVAQVRTPRPRRAYLHVEVEPGEQAQVDWGAFGSLRVGATQRPLSAFVMVSSWSRALFLDFALDQRMETFLHFHRRAFEFFGGVPRRLVYDNLKSVVLQRVGSTIQFNPHFLALAGHYLFEPVAAPVRYPEFKGRVETAIKYVRHSFFCGRSFTSLADLRAQAARWQNEVANQRLHATTRERPAERLVLERARLRPLPERAFDTDWTTPLIVAKDARVRFDANAYSVPAHAVGRTVVVRADDTCVRVLLDGVEIAAHERCWDRRRAIEDPAHLAGMLEHRPAARGPQRRQRLLELGPQARAYLQEIARRRVHLGHEVEKLCHLIDRYGERDVAAALVQAIALKTFGARFVRTLCDQARFARGLAEPPEPIVTGNPAADEMVVEPHDLETYHALFRRADEPDSTDA
jgi:transposase